MLSLLIGFLVLVVIVLGVRWLLDQVPELDGRIKTIIILIVVILGLVALFGYRGWVVI